MLIVFDMILSLESINFFEFRRLYENNVVDAFLIAENWLSGYVKTVTKICRLYGIDNVGIVDMRWNPFRNFYLFGADIIRILRFFSSRL